MIRHTLIIGSAGTGKSTIAKLLKDNGKLCIDIDYDDEIVHWKHKATGEIFPGSDEKSDSYHDWMWDIDKLKNTLDSVDQPLIMCGTANNRAQAYKFFTTVIVLAPSKEAVKYRIANRTQNNFGKDPDDLSWVLQNYDDILQEAVDNNFVILETTNQTPQETLDTILDLNSH